MVFPSSTTETVSPITTFAGAAPTIAKQSFRAVIILCHRYYSKRWKPKEDTAYGR